MKTTTAPETNHRRYSLKIKPQLEPNNWLSISNQKWSAHQTSEPNHKGTPHLGQHEKYHSHPNKIAAYAPYQPQKFIKKDIATTKMGPSNRVGLQKKSFTTNTTKSPTSTHNQHQPPLLYLPSANCSNTKWRVYYLFYIYKQFSWLMYWGTSYLLYYKGEVSEKIVIQKYYYDQILNN
jgi:hypothetical protein